MTRRRSWMVPAVLVLASAPAVAGETSGNVREVMEGGNRFAFDLYSVLASGSDGNLFFSPAGIHTALAMTYAGARGRTAEEMRETLHFASPPADLARAFGAFLERLDRPPRVTVAEEKDGKRVKRRVPAYELRMADALWLQKGYPFREEFTAGVQESFRARLGELDFTRGDEARAVINGWVAEETEERIPELIPPGVITPLTRLVLTNAVYFQGGWEDPFREQATREEPFHPATGDSVVVPMMHREGSFAYAETPNLQLLEMPYRSGAVSMVVLLPRAVDGLAALEGELSVDSLETWMTAADHELVRVTFPRFTFTSRFSLEETLAGMGMGSAFDPDAADFSGMSEADRLWISAVIHQAFVDVDEEGTEAAAATAVAMTLSAMPIPEDPPRPRIFTADHPFLFLIRHRESGAILFLGRVGNPAEGA